MEIVKLVLLAVLNCDSFDAPQRVSGSPHSLSVVSSPTSDGMQLMIDSKYTSLRLLRMISAKEADCTRSLVRPALCTTWQYRVQTRVA